MVAICITLHRNKLLFGWLVVAALMGCLTWEQSWAQAPGKVEKLSGPPLPESALARMGGPLAQVHQVDRLCLSADGKTLASGGQGSLRLWDVNGNKLLRGWTGANGRVLALALSPDIAILATSDSGVGAGVKLWDTETGKERAAIAGNQEPVRNLAFSPDGKLLALGGGAGSDIRIWDLAGGKIHSVLKGPAEVTAVAFRAAGQLASGSTDGTIRVWDLKSGQWNLLGKHAGSGIVALAFAPDGKTLASSGGDDDRILLWDVDQAKVRHTLKGERFNGAALAFSPDGALLASGSANLEVERPALRRPGPFPLPPPPLPRGKEKGVRPLPPQVRPGLPPPPPPFVQPVPLSNDHTVRIWDVATGQEVRRLVGHKGQVQTLAYAGSHIVSGSNDGSARIWEAKGNAVRRLGGHSGMVRKVAFQPDGKILLTSGDDGTARLWDAHTGKEIKQVGKPGAGGTGAFTRDGKRVALIADGGVAVFDLGNGRELFQTSKQENTVAGLDFSPDGGLLASGTVRFLRLFDADGKEILRVDAHRDLIIRLAFSPDGKTLATASWDHTLCLWDVATGKQRLAFPRQASPLESVAFSPDGRLLASGDTFGRLRLWDPATGRMVRSLQEQGPIVFALSFSPDSRFVASSGKDLRARIWEIASGQEVLSLAGHQGEVTCCAFSPDGKLLATGGWDAAAIIWDWQQGWRSAAQQGKDLSILWKELASAEAAVAQRAVIAMASSAKNVVAFLKEQMPTTQEIPTQKVQQWLKDLGNDRFTVRESAALNLRRLGRAIEPSLREALGKADALEVRRRLQALVDSLEEGRLSLEELRQIRAVQALELTASADSRQLLQQWSRGAHGSLLRDEAERALKRLR
jgi:WD40 repeat protein